MGVYIKDLAMPELCKECPFKTCFIRVNIKSYVCLINGGECEKTDCPLIEIIPCKECKNSHMTYDGKCKYCDLERDDDDNFIECYFDGDHFCSYGERANNTRTE